MGQLVCALFDDETTASAAVQRLLDSGVGEHVVSAVVHSGELHHEDLPLSANPTGVRSVEGAAIGSVVGAVLGGLLAGPAGLLAVGPIVAALAGGASGGMYGAIGGAITGRDDIQPELNELSKAIARGQVLVTVELVDDSAEDDERARKCLEGPGSRLVTLP